MARAEACGLPDRCVDLATAAQAAHWFDLETYYAEVRRVARPGAVIALITYGVFSISPEIDPIVRAFHGGTLRAHWPPERRPVDDGYRSLPFPFPEIDAPVMEMSADWTLHDLIGYVGTWSAVRALERDEGSAPFAAFQRDLAAAWGDPGMRRRVRWPLRLRVGRVGTDSA